MVGDLGGGSLELINVPDGAPEACATVPLGALYLGAITPENRKPVRKRIDRHIERLPWIERLAGRQFFAVGGGWRSLARLHMIRCRYPLEIIHGYRIDPDRAARFLDSVVSGGVPAAQPGISRRRLDTMPAAALVLHRLITLGRVGEVVFSAFGLREGCLYDRLSQDDRGRDPLLSGFSDIVRPFSRFPLEEGVLERWVTGFLPARVPARLVHAICMLGDAAWAEHPSYRGEHAFLKVLRLPLVGLEHEERVFVALAVLARYNGHIDHPRARAVARLVTSEQCVLANLIGCVLRFGFSYSGGIARLLSELEVIRETDRVVVRYPGDRAVVLGETVARRLAQLSSVLGRPVIMEPRSPAGARVEAREVTA